MSEPAARREGDEFVVAFEDGEEQRIDLTSVMHRVDAMAYRQYLQRQATPPDDEGARRAAAVEVARERRDAAS